MQGVGRNACDPRPASLSYCCGLNLLGQALKHALEILRQDNLGNIRPETLVPRDDNPEDTVFEVDPIIRLRLYLTPFTAPTHVA